MHIADSRFKMSSILVQKIRSGKKLFFSESEGDNPKAQTSAAGDNKGQKKNRIEIRIAQRSIAI